MKKIVILFAFLLLSFSFSLSVTTMVNKGKIIFTIDGPQNESSNLTIFILKDGLQIRAIEKNNIYLPYYAFIPFNSSGVYELRVIDAKGNYANGNVTIEIPNSQIKTQQKTEAPPIDYALVFALIGILALLLLLLRFLNTKSDNK